MYSKCRVAVKERQILHLLVDSPEVLEVQFYAKRRSGTRIPTVTPMREQRPTYWGRLPLLSQACWQRAGSEAEQLGFEPALHYGMPSLQVSTTLARAL